MTAPHGERSLATDATILIRLLVGCVFLSEGVLKFLYPAALGAGRFLRIGLPWPDVLGPGVGIIEIIGGELILLGLLTRPTAIVLLVDISLAIISTKIPILLGHGFWGFKLPEFTSYGFWSMAQVARVDAAMFLCTLFLVIAGAGSWSLDSYRNRRRE
jgi:putative oxidoreductase